MSVSVGPKSISEFEKFLTNLRKNSPNSPNLPKEQIVEKIIAWVDKNSVDAKSESALLKKQVYLIIADDKLKLDHSDNGKYLKKQSEASDYYFKKIRSAFEPMQKSDPDLAEIFALLNIIKKRGINARQIHEIFIRVVKKVESWSPEQKKMLARKFSRHFRGTFEEILAKNKPDINELSEEGIAGLNLEPPKKVDIDAVILYFTQKVSQKDYNVFFKNIEKEIIPPEGFFSTIQFNYHNDMAFMFRILKNNILNIVLYGILFTIAVVAVLAGLTLFILMTDFSMPFIVASSLIAQTAVELAYIVPIIFMAIATMVAGILHDYDLFDTYFFVAKMLVLTAIVKIPSVIFDVVSYPFKAIASLFRAKPVAEQEGPKPEVSAKPGLAPDPLAAAPKKTKKGAQSKKENSGAKKEESASSSKRPGPKSKPSSADADALD